MDIKRISLKADTAFYPVILAGGMRYTLFQEPKILERDTQVFYMQQGVSLGTLHIAWIIIDGQRYEHVVRKPFKTNQNQPKENGNGK